MEPCYLLVLVADEVQKLSALHLPVLHRGGQKRRVAARLADRLRVVLHLGLRDVDVLAHGLHHLRLLLRLEEKAYVHRHGQAAYLAQRRVLQVAAEVLDVQRLHEDPGHLQRAAQRPLLGRVDRPSRRHVVAHVGLLGLRELLVVEREELAGPHEQVVYERRAHEAVQGRRLGFHVRELGRGPLAQRAQAHGGLLGRRGGHREGEEVPSLELDAALPLLLLDQVVVGHGHVLVRARFRQVPLDAARGARHVDEVQLIALGRLEEVVQRAQLVEDGVLLVLALVLVAHVGELQGSRESALDRFGQAVLEHELEAREVVGAEHRLLSRDALQLLVYLLLALGRSVALGLLLRDGHVAAACGAEGSALVDERAALRAALGVLRLLFRRIGPRHDRAAAGAVGGSGVGHLFAAGGAGARLIRGLAPLLRSFGARCLCFSFPEHTLWSFPLSRTRLPRPPM